MPELPEVETIRRGLEKYLVGHKVELISVLDPLRFIGESNILLDKVVLGLRRRGKGLIIDFEDELSLVIHLKMTGQVIYRGDKTKSLVISSKVTGLPSVHTRVIFTLDHGAELFYNDVRRFGWLKLVKTSEVENIPFIHSLGKEPFVDLTLENFSEVLQGAKAPIKSVLMDQHKIAGIGNIYANDALYEAKINPRRPACSLSRSETEALFTAIHEVMEFSIEHGAASDTNYVDALGQDGRYQEHFRVYNRAGKKCNRCGALIERIVVGGRGTFICAACQK
jgi:formamidopyrimidine-DNA glycosylase